jgi:hypothetical protein
MASANEVGDSVNIANQEAKREPYQATLSNGEYDLKITRKPVPVDSEILATSEISALSGPLVDFEQSDIDSPRSRALSGTLSMGGSDMPDDSLDFPDSGSAITEMDDLSMFMADTVNYNPRPPQPQAFLDWKVRQGHRYGLKVDLSESKENELPEAVISTQTREQFQVHTNVVNQKRIKKTKSVFGNLLLEEGRERGASWAKMKDKKNVSGNMFMKSDGTPIEGRRKVLTSNASLANLKKSGTVKDNPFLKSDSSGKKSKKRRPRKKAT